MKNFFPWILFLLLFLAAPFADANQSTTSSTAALNERRPMERIRPSDDGTHFVGAESGRIFSPWGFNYDHDAPGRLLEDYWMEEWATVAEDFHEMKTLGANVVRIHLQVGRFLTSPDQANSAALDQLRKLLGLAHETGLHLDITGLGCYHKNDTPPWYDDMNEEQRWAAQVFFWESIARVCAGDGAVFCYDLMNEPIIPGKKEEDRNWLTGELGGKYFVQRLTLEPAGRTQKEIARAWIERLTTAIRKVDDRTMITVGVIPWALTFPGAKPLFYDPEVGSSLDFVSIHIYPESGKIDKAHEALSTFDVGKPIVIEEMFPLKCSPEELMDFIKDSRKLADGWISFYWGKKISEYDDDDGISGALISGWLKRFTARPRGFDLPGKDFER